MSDDATRSNPFRNRHFLAWGVVAADVLAAVLCSLLYALDRGSGLSLLSTLAFGLLPLSGAVIIARQPRNPVGWLAAALGLVFVYGDLLAQYGTYALLTHPGRLPFGGLAAWISAWSWTVVYALVIPFLLLIPNGKLLSRRWWALIWEGIVTSAPVTLSMQFLTAPLEQYSAQILDVIDETLHPEIVSLYLVKARQTPVQPDR